MTRDILNKVAKQMGIDLNQYDFVNAEWAGHDDSFLEVTFWKDQGVGANRSKHDVQKKRFQTRALYKAWEAGGVDPADYLTGGQRRIFNIR